MIKIERKTSVFNCSEAERASGVQRLRFVFDVVLSRKQESERKRLLIKTREYKEKLSSIVQ